MHLSTTPAFACGGCAAAAATANAANAALAAAASAAVVVAAALLPVATATVAAATLAAIAHGSGRELLRVVTSRVISQETRVVVHKSLDKSTVRYRTRTVLHLHLNCDHDYS